MALTVPLFKNEEATNVTICDNTAIASIIYKQYNLYRLRMHSFVLGNQTLK